MLEKFPVSQFIPDQEIDQFEIDTQNWIHIFCRPTQGCINSSIQIPGLYKKEDVTPYMHVFAKHVPQFLRQLKEKGLSLQILSTSSIEKKITIRFVYFLEDSFVSELVINVQVAVPY
ncbi:unnamed protein product [Rhizophagus irregularis]|nr:unnamed protein product [Rhizophagus irregularis]